MKKTKVIGLYAGPGTGKSTMAAELFVAMKKQNRSVECIHEYVKRWAWQGTPVKGWEDSFYIFAKQLRLESELYGKVDYLITDSPLGLPVCFEALYRPGQRLVAKAYEEVRRQQDLDGIVTNLDFHLMRKFSYVPEGRYENEEEALKIDRMIRSLIPGLNVSGIEDILLHPQVNGIK
jgi:septum formation inhibitor-activating ATPase MinD